MTVPETRRIHELFETLAVLVPGAPAVVTEVESLTYNELDRRANRLARHLRSRGLQIEERVAVALHRSPEAVVALLAVWKAGGAWISLDLSHPPERLARFLEESGATFLITREETAAALAASAPPWLLEDGGELPPLWQLRIVCLDRDAAEIETHSAAPVRSPAGPEHLAYVPDPTEPEGERRQHRALVDMALRLEPGRRLGPGDRVRQGASGGALFLGEVLLALTRGAALDLVPTGLEETPG